MAVAAAVRAGSTPSALAGLDRGESEAIQLALENGIDLVLMDERLGRKIAASLGLKVVGALGVLRESYRLGLIEEPMRLLDEMTGVGSRISAALRREFELQIESMRL